MVNTLTTRTIEYGCPQPYELEPRLENAQAVELRSFLPTAGAHLCICNGDHWFSWCYLAWEHYNVAVNSPLRFIWRPCTCPPGLPVGEVPKSCPRVADHLFVWMSYIQCIQRQLAYRVTNSCMHLTGCNPTRSQLPSQITMSHLMLSHKAIKESDPNILLSKMPVRRPARQATLRRERKLWKFSLPYPTLSRHAPAPLNPPLHLPRTKLPYRLKTSTNLPTVSRTSSHSSVSQHHQAGMRAQYQLKS